MEYDDAKMTFSKNNRLEPEVRHSADSTQATVPRLSSKDSEPGCNTRA